MNATYSPEDNKLRLYAETRLDSETYNRVKEAGFIWAPKQQLFVAPMWTPAREDLLIELCGEIEDEDKSLAERAEERAGRFEQYSENRERDAEQAKNAVKAIASNIPFGQPILVGHHSEKRARKDAERIQNGMAKAVKMWDQAEYWQYRARGVLANVNHKADRFATARRIKKLEAEKRKVERTKAQMEFCLKFWTGQLKKKDGGFFEVNQETAEWFCNSFDHLSAKFPLSKYPRDKHTYEGEMSLWSAIEKNEGFLTVEQAKEITIPSKQRVIENCNRWISHYENRLAYEKALLNDANGIDSDRNKPEKGGACYCWATHSMQGYDTYSYIVKVNKVSVTVFDNWGNSGGNFTRIIPFDKCHNILSLAKVEELRAAGKLVEFEDKTGFCVAKETPGPDKPKEAPRKDEEIEAMRNTEVKAISAPQLFATPPEIAQRMIDLADIQDGQRILEPSAGTGNLVKAMNDLNLTIKISAVEINRELWNNFPFPGVSMYPGDFLEKTQFELGYYDRIIMNPPFENASDIKHINHARTFLKPGGTLVALCANGPRQQEAFKNIAGHWEVLPEGSFKSQGTMVNVALLIIGGK